MLRAEAGREPHDKALRELIGELSTLSPEFRSQWAAHDVRTQNEGIKRLHHPDVGDLELTYQSLDLPLSLSLSLRAVHDLDLYTAEPGHHLRGPPQTPGQPGGHPGPHGRHRHIGQRPRALTTQPCAQAAPDDDSGPVPTPRRRASLRAARGADCRRRRPGPGGVTAVVHLPGRWRRTTPADTVRGWTGVTAPAWSRGSARAARGEAPSPPHSHLRTFNWASIHGSNHSARRPEPHAGSHGRRRRPPRAARTVPLPRNRRGPLRAPRIRNASCADNNKCRARQASSLRPRSTTQNPSRF
ncbi:MmyB family transcriptional regulator [Streptomyces bobili]